MIRVDLKEEVTFKQRLEEEGGRMSHVDNWRISMEWKINTFFSSNCPMTLFDIYLTITSASAVHVFLPTVGFLRAESMYYT